MASTYVNNLRLNEMATGDASGTWGTTTNTNLEIIGQVTAWGTRAIANASTDNITIADGALDADRCLGLKTHRWRSSVYGHTSAKHKFQNLVYV